MFTDLSDGFTIPGGVRHDGRIVEAIAGRSLAITTGGDCSTPWFHNELIAFNRHMIDVGFIRPGMRDQDRRCRLDDLWARWRRTNCTPDYDESR